MSNQTTAQQIHEATFRKIISTPGGGRWCVETGNGMGGYGHPADHPLNRYCIVEFRGSRSVSYETALSLDAAATYEWVPEAVRAEAKRLLTLVQP